MPNSASQVTRQHLGRERAGHTVQATALVNEAFLQVVKQDVAYARRRSRIKRGGGREDRRSISQGDLAAPDKGIDVLALHEALHRLASFDPRKGQLVELYNELRTEGGE